MNHTKKHQQMALLVVAASLLAGPMVRADVVTDWNAKASALLVDAKLGAPPACRVLAIVHTAVYEAANAITRRYPASGLPLEAAPGASVEAAVAAANHVLHAEIGTGPMPTLTTTSPTAKDVARSWTTIDDFMQEVAHGRIYDGVHYRASTEVGTAMGKQIGALAAAKSLRPLK